MLQGGPETLEALEFWKRAFFGIAGLLGSLLTIIVAVALRERKNGGSEENGNGHGRRRRWNEEAGAIELRIVNIEREQQLWRDRWHGVAGHPESGIAGTITKVNYVVKDVLEHEERLKALERE